MKVTILYPVMKAGRVFWECLTPSGEHVVLTTGELAGAVLAYNGA